MAWDVVEASLEAALPADYKALVEAFGPGAWGDFVHVFQPSHPNPNIDLVTQVERQRQVYEELHRGGEPLPVPLGELMALA